MLKLIAAIALGISAQATSDVSLNSDPESCSRVTWPLSRSLARDIEAEHAALAFIGISLRSGVMVVRNGELVAGNPNVQVVINEDDLAQMQASEEASAALKRARRDPAVQTRWARFFCRRTPSALPTTTAQ
jgi:hypothetical protein